MNSSRWLDWLEEGLAPARRHTNERYPDKRQPNRQAKSQHDRSTTEARPTAAGIPKHGLQLRSRGRALQAGARNDVPAGGYRGFARRGRLNCGNGGSSASSAGAVLFSGSVVSLGRTSSATNPDENSRSLDALLVVSHVGQIPSVSMRCIRREFPLNTRAKRDSCPH